MISSSPPSPARPARPRPAARRPGPPDARPSRAPGGGNQHAPGQRLPGRVVDSRADAAVQRSPCWSPRPAGADRPVLGRVQGTTHREHPGHDGRAVLVSQYRGMLVGRISVARGIPGPVRIPGPPRHTAPTSPSRPARSIGLAQPAAVTAIWRPCVIHVEDVPRCSPSSARTPGPRVRLVTLRGFGALSVVSVEVMTHGVRRAPAYNVLLGPS